MEDQSGHFKTLRRISKEFGASKALAYDWKRTQADFAYTGERTLEMATLGGLAIFAYLSVPVIAGVLAASTRGHFNKNKDFVLTEEPTRRELFNRRVRELGNNVSLVPKNLALRTGDHYGLGDLLTEKVNFTNAGAATGAALGFYTAMHGMLNDYSHHTMPVQGMIAYGLWPCWGCAGLIFGGALGAIGYAVDHTLEDRKKTRAVTAINSATV